MGLEIDAGERDQKTGQHERGKQRNIGTETPRTHCKQHRRERLGGWVARRDRRAAVRAATFEPQPRQQWHEVLHPHGCRAVRTVRARHGEVVRLIVAVFTALKCSALGSPRPLEHARQPMDDGVEKAAHQ